MLLQSRGSDLAAGGQNAQRNRQIETARILGQIGRRQIDRDALVARKLQPAVLDGAAHALACFFHLGVGQPHQCEAGQAIGQMHLDRDGRRIQPKKGAAGYQGKAHKQGASGKAEINKSVQGKGAAP